MGKEFFRKGLQAKANAGKGKLLCRVLAILLILALAAIATMAQTYRLPDTGQTKCYNEHEEIPCPSPGQAFYGQDAQYQLQQPAFHDNGDGTVTDLNTELIWQQGDDQNKKGRTWQQAIDYCESLSLANHEDWRLPTVQELISLPNIGGADAAIDRQFFPGALYSFYWSSSSTVKSASFAWIVSFRYADYMVNDYRRKSNTIYVRCVRGETRNATYLDNLDGTVSDTLTGLIWQQADDGILRDWEQALAYCEGLNFAERSDWRLPNSRELVSLVDYGRYGPAIDPLFAYRSSGYASSTGYAESRLDAWCTYFGTGKLDLCGKTNPHFVRCVGGVPEGPGILTITKTGDGDGTVTGTPSGIDCGPGCIQQSKAYEVGTAVTLKAVAANDSIFLGWSGGGCFGTDDCIVGMDTPNSVTASFWSIHIAGLVKDNDGTPLPEVTLSAAGPTTGQATTGPDGRFSIAGMSNGSYILTPAKSGYLFSPRSRSFNINGNDVVGQDFVGTAAPQVDFVGTPTQGSNPLTVSFSVTSSGGPISSYNWDFGDGTAGTNPSPVKTYAITRTYTVTLSVEGPGGTDTEIKSNYITVLPAADLSITKSDSPDPVRVGEHLRYTIKVTNNGPDAATGVVVTDPLTSNPAFVSVTPSQGTSTLSGNTVTCDLGNLAKNATATCTIIVVPVAEGTLMNTATVRANEADLKTENNSATSVTEALEWPTVAIITVGATASESGGMGQFFIYRTGTAEEPLTVNYAVAGTATNGVDYAVLPGALTIPAHSWSGSIIVAPKEDTLYEGDETVILTLTENPLSYLVGLPKSAEVVIVDNEPKPPTVTIAATDPLASERRGDTGQFTFYRTGDTSKSLIVKYTVSGTATNRIDYMYLPGSVTIPARALSASVNVVPVDDRDFEGEETVLLTLQENAAYWIGAPGSATVTIADNDLPVVSIKATNASASEAGPTPGMFTISRTGKNSEPLLVYYTVSGTATNGVDYGAIGGVITMPAGSATDILVINPVDDQDFEGSETVTVTLASNPAYTLSSSKSATVTIADNDLPTVTVIATDAEASEPGTNKGQFTVSRSGVTTNPLQVRYSLSGTATNGMDYTRLNGIITIPARTSSGKITVSPRDDKIVEGTETVIMTLTPGSSYRVGAQGDATVTIADND